MWFIWLNTWFNASKLHTLQECMPLVPEMVDSDLLASSQVGSTLARSSSNLPRSSQADPSPPSQATLPPATLTMGGWGSKKKIKLSLGSSLTQRMFSQPELRILHWKPLPQKKISGNYWEFPGIRESQEWQRVLGHGAWPPKVILVDGDVFWGP